MIMVILRIIISFFCLFDYLILRWIFPLLILFIFISWGFDGIGVYDSLRLWIIFIRLWVIVLSYFSIPNYLDFSYLISFIFFSIIIRFITNSYFLFYIIFEIVFILIFVFLMGWGNSLERLQASFYMFFYTLIFSFPFLLFILYCYKVLPSSDFYSFYIMKDFHKWLFLFLFIIFIVKLPLYGLHMWLPKAHVEAPVGGSMILAGVLLKLGGYGFIRFWRIFYMLRINNILFSLMFFISLYGATLISFLCLRQSDLKIIIAYSSIVHIRIIFCGLISFSIWGIKGSLLIMVAHGFISPLIFFLINFMYDNNFSRRIFLLKGYIIINPIFCLMWFLCNFLNLGVPPFISFFSELIIIRRLRNFYLIEIFLIILVCIFTGVYRVFLYVTSSHGVSLLNNFYLNKEKQFFLFFLHIYFVIIYIILFLWWLNSL